MTGLELYQMYVRKYKGEHNWEVNEWGDLHQMDRDVWNALAAELQLRG